MGRQFEPGRALEVIFPKYGSAYQIGGRLVLTAAHVLSEVGSDCRVRAKQSLEKVDAKVVWKAQRLDIALIELPETVPACEPAVLGRLPEAKVGEKIRFQMYGYPSLVWMEQEEGPSAAVGLQVEGTIYLADIAPDGLLVLRVEEPLTSEYGPQMVEHLMQGNSGPFQPSSEWRGMSGAAVVCEGVVVGVQKQHPRLAQPAYLQAEPFWKVYEDKQWCDLLKQHNIDPEPTIARVAGGETASFSNLDPSSHPNNLRNRGIEQQDFFGREADYQALHELMQEVGSSGLAAIIGMPGVGKSELAIQYGRSHRETYQGGVAWFSAVNFGEELRDWMQAEFCPDRDLRHLPNLTQQVALGWKEWQSFCGGRLALVIVDDVTDYRQQVEPYLPPVMTEVFPFRILLTSRAHLVSPLSISTLELRELAPDAAVAMLTRFAGANRIDADHFTAASICQRLAYLPLAIALVGCWLSIDVDRSLNDDLMASLEREGLAAPALEHDPQVVSLTAERGVMAAFAVSWQQAGATNPDAQQLARVLTLFAPVDIAWELVVAMVQTYLQLYPPASEESKPQQEVIQRQRGWRRWWQWLCQRIQQWIGKPPSRRPSPHTSKTINGALEARGTLLRLNLLQRIDGEKHYYRLHPLLREYFTKQWSECDQEGWNLAFAEAIGAWVKTVPREMTWEQAAAYQDLQPQLPIAQQILQRRVETAPDPETMNRYRTKGENIRGVIFRLSKPVLFEATFEQARKIHEQAKAAAQGNVSLSSQKFAKALEEYRRVVEQARATFPANSLQLAGYLKQLANLFRELGRYQDGIAPATEALSIAESYLRPTRLADYLNTLGLLHYYQGNYVEALPLLERALAIYERELGGNHRNTAVLLSNLAQLYREMGRYEAALPLHKRALAIREQELGGNHPNTASSLNNLALLYEAMGRYEAALPLYERALAIREQELGGNHPDTAGSLNNLARLYSKMERYEAALPLYERALAIRERELGGNHPATASSLNNLAALYEAMGRYEVALPLLERALAIRERELGGNHPDTAGSLNNLAALYTAMGHYEAALPLYERALVIREQELGGNHPDTASSLNNLAGLYREMGRYEAALPLYERALAIREQELGGNHPDTASSLNNLAGLYREMGRYEAALPLYERALAIREQELGGNHPDTASSLNNLAGLYREMGLYGDAEEMYVRSLAIFTGILRETHPNTQTAIQNFRTFLHKVIEAERVEELSDHPLTQATLNEIRGQ